MIIQDVYNSFDILPSLQLHMLRVAAVTQEVCKQIDKKLSTETTLLITASLLHDLGNLVKFDMTLFPGLFEPEWVKYRKHQQQKTKEQYGFPAEPATIQMCKELPLSSSTQILLESVLTSDFKQAIENKLSLKVLLIHFADMNIWIDWYLPRQERIQKLRNRFIRNKGYTEQQANIVTQELLQAWEYTSKLLQSLWRNSSLVNSEYIDQQAQLLRSFQII